EPHVENPMGRKEGSVRTDEISLFDKLPLQQAPLQQKTGRARKTGHAWLPGTGPKGETCRTCKHYVIRQWAGTYRKCDLMRDHWTKGPGSDIRARDAACKKWEAS